MSYLKNIENELKPLQEILRRAKRAINDAGHNIYREITSHDIERLKEKCMGDDLYRVQFHYTIEFVGRENGVYVVTHHYGFWRLEENGEWTRLDIDEEGDAA